MSHAQQVGPLASVVALPAKGAPLQADGRRGNVKQITISAELVSGCEIDNLIRLAPTHKAAPSTSEGII